ncbi:MAG TPA: putative capsular polysaccharide synthesis family protein [Thermoanaerobaculia bacterium]|nr:putative capsular polysaccharide synthesis family protein [Thermoanaerobaculia bacterium]
MRRNLLGIVPVIVYQMAKVGSSSVVAGLQATRLPAFHVHRMDAEHLHQMRENRRALGWFIPPIPAHDHLGLRLRDQLIDRGGRAAIVTLVRDPIARNISSYFEHLDAIWNRPNAHESVSLELLIEGFRSRYTHEEPLTWFDDEMLPVTGIDVYEHPFPASGHLVVRREKIDLLMMKSELPDGTKAEALSQFLGMRGLALAPANRTSDKTKGLMYRQFLDALQLDDQYVEQMLENRYTRHFYTSAELDSLRRKYTTITARGRTLR